MVVVRHRADQPGGASAGTFYFHPWEIDPGQPRISLAPLRSKFRHYTNLGVMEAKLKRLLREFRWDRVDAVYGLSEASKLELARAEATE